MFSWIPAPPPSNVQEVACVFPFARERGYFLPFSLGKILLNKHPLKGGVFKGVFLNQSPGMWGIFQKLSEKLRKMGDVYLDVHVHVFSLAFNM